MTLILSMFRDNLFNFNQFDIFINSLFTSIVNCSGLCGRTNYLCHQHNYKKQNLEMRKGGHSRVKKAKAQGWSLVVRNTLSFLPKIFFDHRQRIVFYQRNNCLSRC